MPLTEAQKKKILEEEMRKKEEEEYRKQVQRDIGTHKPQEEDEKTHSSKKDDLPQELKDFMLFMGSHTEWVMTSKSKEHVLYTKHYPEQKASCLVTLILAFFFIFPAILYLYFASKAGKDESISLTYDQETNLISFSGTTEGRSLYTEFVRRQEEKTGSLEKEEKPVMTADDEKTVSSPSDNATIGRNEAIAGSVILVFGFCVLMVVVAGVSKPWETTQYSVIGGGLSLVGLFLLIHGIGRNWHH